VLRRNSGNVTARLSFLAALTLAGAGAGVAATLATSGSGPVRAAGGTVGGVLGLIAAAWIDKTRQRQEGRAAALADRDRVLNPIVSDPGQDTSVLGMLLPTRKGAAPFRGRTADLAWLGKWCDDLDENPAVMVTGPAGVGKTRLVAQFALDRVGSWAAGWLRAGCGSSALAAVRGSGEPALIVVDDADQRPDLAALLDGLAASPAGSLVRVVLITRNADFREQMASRLQERNQWILAEGNIRVRPIGPFGSADDHRRWFSEAVRAYAVARHTPPPDLPPAISGREITQATDEPILTLQAQALLVVLDSERGHPLRLRTQTLPFDQVAAALLAHEQRRWREAAAQPQWGLTDLTAAVQDRAVAALLLAGAGDESHAAAALRWVPDLADASEERLAKIARWAFYLYPPDPAGAIQIRPDMLAEWFLVTQLTRTPELSGHLSHLTRTQTHTLLITLARASDHMPSAPRLYRDVIAADVAALLIAGVAAALTAQAGQPLLDAVLASLVSKARWTADELTELDRQRPADLLPRTSEAIGAAQVQLLRESGTAEDLARALRSHGLSLRFLGRYQEALAVDDEALGLYRDLAAASPTHQRGLAATLLSYGVSLRFLGRYQEALAAFDEALGLLRDLTAANPAHQPGLALTLQSRGVSLRLLGRYQEALAAFDEALGLYRDLTAANPAHQPDLAATLQSRAVSLRHLGRYQEALAAFDEALGLLRDLTAANPTHQPGLAATLQSRAVSLRLLERYQEALAVDDEALDLYRDLAAANPAHQPDLAATLQDRGLSLQYLGRYQEALAAFDEALDLYRDLTAANPAHQPRLAYTLHCRGLSLRFLGRYQEALAVDDEALDLYRDLAAANSAHQPDLALTLQGRGVSLGNVERYQEALAAFDEALDLYRDLAAANPAHQPDLAVTLQDRGLSLQSLGRYQEALAAFDEALGLYRQLAVANPDLYEKAYQRHLSELRRKYDLRGDQATGAGLHLRHDNISGSQP
jgi:tetratricopeptide (TPR) repeat protein